MKLSKTVRVKSPDNRLHHQTLIEKLQNAKDKLTGKISLNDSLEIRGQAKTMQVNSTRNSS